jgi:tRNA(fMet)-specific endonuclease VapC
VGQRLSFDTTFLIDFQRERRTGATPGCSPAHDYLRAEPSVEAAVSAVVLGEFSEGFPEPRHPLVEWVRRVHKILPVDATVALEYARVARRLRAAGQMIGGNDLWIAATALRYGLPVVTANVEHFARIPELDVRAYR